MTQFHYASSLSLALLLNGVAVVDKHYRPPMVAHAAEEVARRDRLDTFRLPPQSTGEDSRHARKVTYSRTPPPPVLCEFDGKLYQVLKRSRIRQWSLSSTLPHPPFKMPAMGCFSGGEISTYPQADAFANTLPSGILHVPSVGCKGSRDYLVDVGNIVYDGKLFTGVNFGRYANDVGLMDTINFAVENAKLSVFPISPKRQIRHKSVATANCSYREERACQSKRLVVVTRRTIEAGGPVELSVAYDFLKFWVTGVAENPSHFPSCVADPILWLMLSEYCNWTNKERRNFTEKIWQEGVGLAILDASLQQLYQSAPEPPGLTCVNDNTLG